MKKVLFALSFFLCFSLCGCSTLVSSVFTDNNVETLKSWSFQFNEGTNDYSIFFALLNQNDEYISADVNVDIRIVNESNEEIYNETKSVSQSDFGYYTSQIAGEQYLANVRIPASDIAPGKSSSGTVFLTVYKSDAFSFDEVNCSTLYCLPIKDVQLTFDSFPIDLRVKGYDGSTESIIQINDVSYEFEKDYLPQLKITILGTKTYGNSNSSYDIISYKLYDSDGNMVSANNIYFSLLSKGDKFRDDSVVIYDITPGESYTLKLLEYDWERTETQNGGFEVA